MKGMVLGILLIIAACTQQPAPQVQVPLAPVQPGVSFGYVGNQYMAHVVDQSGQSYMMDYMLFQQLINQGGYNSVSQYYYSHPQSPHLRVWSNAGWHPSYTTDATHYGAMYRNSYHDANKNHRVYVPAVTVGKVAPVASSALPAPVSGPAIKSVEKREITVAKVATAPSATPKVVTVAKVTPVHASPPPRAATHITVYKSSSSGRKH
jgi:hypothetical protein